jgi:hypothetical protein
LIEERWIMLHLSQHAPGRRGRFRRYLLLLDQSQVIRGALHQRRPAPFDGGWFDAFQPRRD